MKTKASIRGIYTTALTKLLLDHGVDVNKPSKVIAERFRFRSQFQPSETVITDRYDRQGVVLSGYAEETDTVIEILKEEVPETVTRERSLILDDFAGKMQILPGFSSWDVEFTFNSKKTLDQIRNTVKPTILDHHLLKVVSPERVDEAEAELERFPEGRDELGRKLKNTLIYRHHGVGAEIQFEHVKPDGAVINLVGGKILASSPGQLTVKRTGFKGRTSYDGVDVPKEPGDYALTEVKEASWVIRHRYFSQDNVLKGEFCNISTPVELYPDKVRYVDLEVDVVRKTGGPCRIIDMDKLDAALDAGYIGGELRDRAKEKAQGVYRVLQDEGELSFI